MIEVNDSKREKKARAYIYRFLCICLLNDTDGCVCEEDEKDYEGLGECTEKRTTFLRFHESEDEGDQGRCE